MEDDTTWPEGYGHSDSGQAAQFSSAVGFGGLNFLHKRKELTFEDFKLTSSKIQTYSLT